MFFDIYRLCTILSHVIIPNKTVIFDGSRALVIFKCLALNPAPIKLCSILDIISIRQNCWNKHKYNRQLSSYNYSAGCLFWSICVRFIYSYWRFLVFYFSNKIDLFFLSFCFLSPSMTRICSCWARYESASCNYNIWIIYYLPHHISVRFVFDLTPARKKKMMFLSRSPSLFFSSWRC